MTNDSQTPEEDTSPPQLARELLRYTAIESTAEAIEAERRRLSGLLESSVVEPLNLLLSQASVYEQTLSAHPTVRMAIAVLLSLGRQALQQARDLQTNLNPAILDALGLEPALETLASQVMRVYGLHITLTVERLRERLPIPIELALFRLAQDALDRATRYAHASRAAIRLAHAAGQLVFSYEDNSTTAMSRDTLREACQRVEQLGGDVHYQINPQVGLQLTIRFTIEKPPSLTAREMETLRLVAEGLSNKEIASALNVSARTVNFHLDNIYSKLGVNSRTEAVMVALRQGWLRFPG